MVPLCHRPQAAGGVLRFPCLSPQDAGLWAPGEAASEGGRVPSASAEEEAESLGVLAS